MESKWRVDRALTHRNEFGYRTCIFYSIVRRPTVRYNPGDHFGPVTMMLWQQVRVILGQHLINLLCSEFVLGLRVANKHRLHIWNRGFSHVGNKQVDLVENKINPTENALISNSNNMKLELNLLNRIE